MNKELKLTDEQIDAAAKAGYESMREYLWDTASSASRQDSRTWAKAAAPYLQSAWEPPTPEECQLLARENSPMCADTVGNILRAFVNMRNAALLPVDPRRKKIIDAIRDACKDMPSGEAIVFGTITDIFIFRAIADRILASLDKAEGKDEYQSE